MSRIGKRFVTPKRPRFAVTPCPVLPCVAAMRHVTRVTSKNEKSAARQESSKPLPKAALLREKSSPTPFSHPDFSLKNAPQALHPPLYTERLFRRPSRPLRWTGPRSIMSDPEPAERTISAEPSYRRRSGCTDAACASGRSRTACLHCSKPKGQVAAVVVVVVGRTPCVRPLLVYRPGSRLPKLSRHGELCMINGDTTRAAGPEKGERKREKGEERRKRREKEQTAKRLRCRVRGIARAGPVHRSQLTIHNSSNTPSRHHRSDGNDRETPPGDRATAERTVSRSPPPSRTPCRRAW